MERWLVYIFIAAAVLITLKLFSLPLKWLFKLLFNTVLGYVLLFVFNWLGSYIGITLGMNFINALVVGILGLPGLVVLLLIRWLFMIQ